MKSLCDPINPLRLTSVMIFETVTRCCVELKNTNQIIKWKYAKIITCVRFQNVFKIVINLCFYEMEKLFYICFKMMKHSNEKQLKGTSVQIVLNIVALITPYIININKKHWIRNKHQKQTLNKKITDTGETNKPKQYFIVNE